MLGYQEDDAEDFVNSFFLDLLEKDIDLDSIATPQAYLSTAFRRKLIDHYRRSKAKPKLYVAGNDINDKYAESSAQELIEQTESDKALMKQVRDEYLKLPERCRKIIYLKFFKGLNTEQIALNTSLTKRTVYNNLFEGIKLLRSALAQKASATQYVATASL